MSNDTVDEDFLDGSDETDAEREAREANEVVFDELSQKFVDQLIDKLMLVSETLAGHPFYPYQVPFARRLWESLIINDGDVLSLMQCRQSGKTETISNVVAAAMIMLPRLAKVYPHLLGKYKAGMFVGAFAPVDDQADTLAGRIIARLTSEEANAIVADPEINDKVLGKGKRVWLRNCKSEVRKTTCHPRATIEGRSYHLIIIDEAQGADETVVNKSIFPMGAAYNATKVMAGTPTYTVGVFYKTIQTNKRKFVNRRGIRQCHYQVDWKEAAKANSNYEKFVRAEMLRIGEDSDEFKLAYKCLWLLDKGMFATSETLNECEDTSMQSLVHAHWDSPVVAGIDCGRKQDKTIVTVVWVDWDDVDGFGFYNHRVLSWLDLAGMDWEEQYFRIVEFLSNYRVWKVGIDVGGLGDTVAQRLKLLMPQVEIVELGSAQTEQSERWKYLRQLLDRRRIGWPAGAKVRRLKVYRRFRQEMEDLQLIFRGPYVLAEAPNVKDAHDDYPDSLSMAAILTKDAGHDDTPEVTSNPFYQ